MSEHGLCGLNGCLSPAETTEIAEKPIRTRIVQMTRIIKVPQKAQIAQKFLLIP